MPSLPPKLAAANERRIALIERDVYQKNLTAEEQQELTEISAQIAAYIEEKYPPPREHLEALKRKLEELEKKKIT